MAKHIFIGGRFFRFDLATITVEPVLFLYMFTNFLYFPTLQALIFNKVCLQRYTKSFCEEIQRNETFKDDHESENHYITSETSFWILRTTIALTVSSFFIVLLYLGAFGDKYGRKLPVLLPCVGAFAAYLSGLLNAKYMSAPLAYILIGPIINGLCGGFIACLMAVYSYIGHVSSSESKMTRVGVVEAMVFLSGTIGVFVSGVMLDNQGYIFTFAAMCVAIGIAFIYALLWLDNLRPQSTGTADQGCCSLMLKFFKESFRCLSRRRERNTFSSILLQVITLDVLMLCTSGDMDISLLYLKKEPLDFSLTLFGYYRGLDNFLRGIIMITFVPLVKRLTSVRDLPLVMVGLLSYAAGFIIIGAARVRWMVFLAAVVGMLKGIPSAGLRATMSSMVNKDEQGRLFGIIAASESLVSLLASVLFNNVFPATYNIFPGLVYMIGAGLILIMFLVIIYVHRTLPQTDILPDYHAIDEDTAEDDEAILAVQPGN